MNPTGETEFSEPFYHRFTTKLFEGELAWVLGAVTGIRRSKNSHFFDLLHALGSLQIVAERTTFSDTWDTIRAIKLKDRIKVQGRIGRTEHGTLSLFLNTVPVAARVFLDETLFSTDADYRQIGSSILISQARVAAEFYLTTEEYRRVDPRYISASWPSNSGMIPLNVSYQGFGIPVYLVPSPAQQLSRAIAATGDDRVFCSATSFTSSYRQPSDGVENAIVMAMTLGVTLDDLLSHALNLLSAVCHSLPGIDRQYGPENIPRRYCPLSSFVPAEDVEGIAIWVHPRDDKGVQPFRVVIDKGLTPIEGCIEQQEGGIAIGVLVFYAERILPLAEHVQFRTLRHLGPESSKSNAMML